MSGMDSPSDSITSAVMILMTVDPPTSVSQP